MARFSRLTVVIATVLLVGILLSGFHVTKDMRTNLIYPSSNLAPATQAPIVLFHNATPTSASARGRTSKEPLKSQGDQAKLGKLPQYEANVKQPGVVKSPPQPVRPKIMFWAKPFHSIGWTMTTIPNGDGACDISLNRKDLSSADAVVFFMKSANPNDRPNKATRRPDQVYVWWAQESPWTVKHYYHHALTEYNNYFNWTMTFRMNSDVVAAMWPISSMDYLMMKLGRKDDMLDKNLTKKPRLAEKEFQREVKHLMSLKKKFVSWIASDCDVTWGAKHRIKLIGQIENEGKVKIDRFGKCANNPIPLNNTVLFQTLSPYKFYLAFENSWHCKDYLTEKTLFNALVAGNVPVIHGPSKANTAEILPTGSFIHIEDFKTIGEMGAYLKYLDQNDTAYMEYFKWWKEPGVQDYPRFGFNYGPKYLSGEPSYRRLAKDEFQDDWQELERFGMYHLCRKLMRGDHKNSSKTVPDLAKWWYGVETKECLGE